LIQISRSPSPQWFSSTSPKPLPQNSPDLSLPTTSFFAKQHKSPLTIQSLELINSNSAKTENKL
jgi:hypothetical protein